MSPCSQGDELGVIVTFLSPPMNKDADDSFIADHGDLSGEQINRDLSMAPGMQEQCALPH